MSRDTGESDLAAWRSARTLADLGELTARWLEGTVASVPGYCGPPDRGDEGAGPGPGEAEPRRVRHHRQPARVRGPATTVPAGSSAPPSRASPSLR